MALVAGFSETPAARTRSQDMLACTKAHSGQTGPVFGATGVAAVV